MKKIRKRNKKTYFTRPESRVAVGVALGLFPIIALAQLSVSDMNTGGQTAQTAVAEILGQNNSAVVSNVVVTGDSRCAGLFTGGDGLGGGVLGFDSGVVIGTGWAMDAEGPNISDETTGEFFTGGDLFLDSLIPGEITFDACVLEFNFECPLADTVSVEYVMGSEEFNEFVGEGANDVFGFALNGVNIATIPGSGGLPVSIENINCGNPYDPNSSEPYCGLFINNDPQDGGGNIDIEADGLTTVLTATGNVLPGTNSMKFAVGDVLDEAFDTWVFLKSGSFQCQTPQTGTPVTKTFLSTTCTAYEGSNVYANEDVLEYDEDSDQVTKVFDGSDVGIKYTSVTSFSETKNGDFLISLADNFNVPGLGDVETRDILRFEPTSSGDNTAGTFTKLFDGSANGLGGYNVNINAFQFEEDEVTGTDHDGDGVLNEQDPCPADPQNDIDGDGLCGDVNLYFSLAQSVSFDNNFYADEDIIVFDEATESYSLYFNGSKVGLSHSDIDALKILDDGSILMSFRCNTSVTGVGYVEDEDVVRFIPTTLGVNTAGSFELYLDGSEIGLQGYHLDFNAVGQTTVIENN